MMFLIYFIYFLKQKCNENKYLIVNNIENTLYKTKKEFLKIKDDSCIKARRTLLRFFYIVCKTLCKNDEVDCMEKFKKIYLTYLAVYIVLYLCLSTLFQSPGPVWKTPIIHYKYWSVFERSFLSSAAVNRVSTFA